MPEIYPVMFCQNCILDQVTDIFDTVAHGLCSCKFERLASVGFYLKGDAFYTHRIKDHVRHRVLSGKNSIRCHLAVI